jgi:hypothetical protein
VQASRLGTVPVGTDSGRMVRRPISHSVTPILISVAVLVVFVAVPGVAEAATTCGASNGHTLCLTVPDAPLTGPTPITVKNTSNTGVVIFTWIPSGGTAIPLIKDFAPSPETGDYSFVWPTQKYLDASGVLRLQAGSASSTPLDVPMALSNGNTTDFQHSPSDWASFLPGPWTASQDPVIAAVGDGPSDEPRTNAVAQSIVAAHPGLFTYLGDIYETGTFTEDLNHFGQNSMDGGPGTLWGQLGTITQPTIGNHEAAANVVDWQDYFHQRPLYTSFRFGNVLFFDLASDVAGMSAGSAQYNYVKGILTSSTNPPPPCILTYFHKPVLTKDTISSGRLPMWTLLTRNGGDLVLNGHYHSMIQYKPLNDQLQLPSPGQPTMVELISGSGGRGLQDGFTADPRVEWSLGKVPGATYVTLNGAANGGTPASLSWAYKDINGNVLTSGTRDCGTVPIPPPSITGFSPTSGAVGSSVTINGSGFTGATDVRFKNTRAGSYTVNSDGQITATVPVGASSGPISITTPGGAATSSDSFTQISTSTLTFGPDADTYVNSGTPNSKYGAATSMTVDGSPIKDLLMRFTVSGVGTNSIVSVKLRLYCTNASDAGGTFYRVPDNTWPESTVTWNSAPPADASASIGSIGKVSEGQWYQVNVSSFVTGDGTYSMRVMSVSTNGAIFSTKEGTAGFAPQLVVTVAD